MVVAVVEGGGHGGVGAAPVVEQVMERYFRKTRAAAGDQGEAGVEGAPV